ncbi:MAG: right-handed parallel beta-helix repeat-containing protein [Pirellulales bacterium]
MIETSGSQSFGGAVTLLDNTNLVGDSLALSSGVEGGTKNLVLNFAQTTSLDGSFANITDLTSEGDVSLNGTILTLGNQTYNANASLSGDTTLEGNALALSNGMEGNAHNLALDFTQTTALDGSFANITDLTSEGSVSLNGTIATLGDQLFNASATLVGNTSINSNATTFAGPLDGAFDLTVPDSTSAVTFAGRVGFITPLAGLDVDATTINVGEDIKTSGTQIYREIVHLTGQEIPGNNLDDDLDLLIDEPITLIGDQGDFRKGFEGNGQHLVLSFDTNTWIDSWRTPTSQLGRLYVTSSNPLYLGGTISTSGDQIYSVSSVNVWDSFGVQDTNLIADGQLVLPSDILPMGNNANLTFDSPVVQVQGSVGVDAANFAPNGNESGLKSFINFNTTSRTNLTLVGDNGTVSARTLNLHGHTLVAKDTTFLAVNASFGNVDGGNSLTEIVLMDAAAQNGTATLDGSNWSTIGSLSYTGTNGTLNVQNSVISTANQTYNGNVVLSGSTTLQAGVSGSVTLATVDAATGTESLNVAVGASISASGNIGLGTALASINLSSGDSTSLQGTIRTADGQQSYGSEVYLTDNLTLESGSGDISFGNGIGFVSGPAAGLTINSTGTTTLADTVNVRSIATDAGGETRLGTKVATSGNTQYYADPVVLTKDSTLSSPNSSITFASTVDSDATARALSLSAGGNISFNDAVGSLSKLASLTLAQAFAVEAQSTVAIDGTGRDLDGLLIESGVNNVTMTQPGSTIESAGNQSAGHAAVRFAGGSANTQIANLTVTDSDGTGLMAGPGSYANTSVTASIFSVKNGTSFAIDLDAAQGLTVGGTGTAANIFRNAVYGGGAAGDLTGTTVVGNSFENVLVGFRLNDAENFSLSGTNTFESYAASQTLDPSVRPTGSTTPPPSNPSWGPATQTGLYAIGSSEGTIVAGNHFENGFGGLTITEATNLTINGNNTIEVFNDTGITVYGDVSGTVIENNTIAGDINATGTTGLRLVDAANLSVSNNTFSEVETGLLAEGVLTGTVVSNNTFDGTNGTTGARITGSQLLMEKNTIANFSGNGIEVDGNTAINNALLENAIYKNGGKGIALLNGGNNDQPAPDPEQVLKEGESLTVKGTITVPVGSYRFEIFRNYGVDEQGTPLDEYGFQGREFLGSSTVTSTGGPTSFEVTVPMSNPGLGGWVTMTATSLSAESQPLDTSEFSKGMRIPRGTIAVGSAPVSFGLDSPPEARLYNVGALGMAAIARNTVTDAEGFNPEVTLQPLLTVSMHGQGSSNLAAVYGMDFASSFRGGLRVANTDLNNDGYDELIVVPGALPASDANTFGSALRTVGIFNSNPNGSWTTASIDMTDVFGEGYTDGFTLTAVKLVEADAQTNPFGAAAIVVSSCLPTGPFNGAVAYTMTTTERGGQPSLVGDVVKTPNIAEMITDVAAGTFEASPVEVETLVLATNGSGQSNIRLFSYDATVSTETLVTQGAFTVSLNLNHGNGEEVDIFANGVSLSAGDMNGDTIDDLVVGAGAGGMGNFRVIDGNVLMAGVQSAFDSALAMTSGPFSTGVVGGRYANFTPSNGATASEQIQNLDYFYGENVPGFTGRGFNSPLLVRLADVDGDLQEELFVSIGGVNSDDNAILHFRFDTAQGWIFSQSFRAINLGDGSFKSGEGVRFG